MNTNVTNSEIKYQAQDLLKQAQDLQDLSSSTNSQLIWIASISLLVGGIGVMNIMLVSVTERTREIGLKKAIGAKKSRILWQFLTEAAVLTSLGGIVGVGAGIGLAAIISRVTSAPVAISVPSIIIAVVFSMVIGICAGTLSTLGFSVIAPKVCKLIRGTDTCGVHNLHGMPGLLGGLFGIAITGNVGVQLGAVVATVVVGLVLGRVCGAILGLFGTKNDTYQDEDDFILE